MLARPSPTVRSLAPRCARALTVGVALLALAVAAFLAPAARAQSAIPAEDVKRYRKELAPGAPLEKRLAAIENVAFYDTVAAAKLLMEHLVATLERLDELGAERKAVDGKIDKILRAQIEKGGKGGTPNYSGVEELQLEQKTLGMRISNEEAAVVAYGDAFTRCKRDDTLDYLMAAPPKKPARLRLVLLEVLGRIDHGKVAEHLIGQLDDPVVEVRLAVAAALLKQRPEFIPPGALAPLLRGPEWQERSIAVDALARIGDRTALELLINQTAKETGKPLADLCGRLEQITGQKFGKTPAAGVDWWQRSRDAFAPRGIDVTQPAQVSKETGKYADFFKIKFDSLKVVYVVDISGSMLAAIDDYEDLAPEAGKSRVDLMRREVKGSIQSLPPEASFNVIAYSDVVIPWNDRNLMATPDNKKKAAEWLDGLAAAGQTNIFDALETAFRLAPNSGKDKYYATTGDTILFLSDGGPTCGRTTDCEEILREVKKWNETRRITIHAVGIGAQTVENFLKALAKENGGNSTFIKK